MPLGHQPGIAASWNAMGQPSDSEDYRARSRAPARLVRVLLGVRSLHRSDTMGAESDRLCARNYSVQPGCRIGRVRQRGCGRGCGNLDDEQLQFGLAVSHRATLRIVPVTISVAFFGVIFLSRAQQQSSGM